MAAITTIITGPQSTKRVRTAAAVGAATRTDWVATPSWARYLSVYFTVTVVTTSAQLLLLNVDPIALNDSTTVDMANVNTTGTTSVALTAAAMLVVNVGPGVTGIANAVTNSATANSQSFINMDLPAVIGMSVVTIGASTSYTVTAEYRN